MLLRAGSLLTKLAGSGGFSSYFEMDFLNNPSIPNGFTFARSDATPCATRLNSSGLLETVAANVPRFDYDPVTLAPKGILLEGSRTNIILQSSTLEAGSWAVNAGDLSSDATQKNLFGNYGTSKFVPDATSSIHRCQFTWNPADGTTYAVSVFLKSAGVRYTYINTSSNLFATVCVDLQTGSYVTGGSPSNVTVTLLQNGFYKVTYTGVGQNVTGNYIWLQANNSLSATDATYSSDGTSGFYIGGVQVEAGSFPTSYIPTASAAATRAADSLYTTSIPWFNATQGTMVAQFIIPNGVNGVAQIADMGTYQFANIQGSMVAGTYSPGLYTSNTYPLNTIGKAGMSYAASSRALCLNAGTVSIDANTPSFGSTLYLGQSSVNNQYLNGWLQSFNYTGTAVSSAQLQALTT